MPIRKHNLFSPVFLLCSLLLSGFGVASAQDFPEVPANVQFGGIIVKFDNGARRIIEADIRSLMANKRFWDDKMDRAVLYFPILEGVLIEEEVPIDFKYLAVQESSLTPDAVSTSNAVGFWQFKQETAQELGLRVDNQIDERKNITASTRAAAHYLKRSNQQFNNWVSSLYSYYLGMGGISKLVPPEWSYAREVTLNARTDRYVLRFFAHKIALEAGLERHRTANSIVLLEYPQGRGRTFETVARELELDPLELRRYNRWIESDQIPADRDYALALPVSSSQINSVREKLALGRQAVDTGMDFAAEDIGFPVLRKASVQLKGRNEPIFYETNGLPGVQARPGDKASDLARAAKVSTSAFLKYNDLGSRDPLVPGEVYYLAKKNRKAMVPFHTVREGETIRSVSQIYGVRTKDLLKYNRISNRNLRLQTGRVMWLMKKRPKGTPVEIIDKASPASAPYAQPELVGNPSSGTIPQKPSERKKYTPKLAESPSDPVVKAEAPAEKPAAQVVEDKPAVRPAVETAPVRPPTTGGNDRIVIIAQEEGPAASPFDPERKTPQPARSGPRPAGTASTSPAATTRPVPASPADNVSSRTSAGVAQYHSVESGQTYYSISKLYNVEIGDLLAWNKLTLDDRLAVGQRLAVRAPGRTSGESTAVGGYTTHTVVSGETLFRIARNYGVTMEEIQQANNMGDANVKLGEKLKIPKK